MKSENTQTNWDALSRLFHWLGAALIAVLLAHGWWMKTILDRPIRLDHYSWHVSIGYAVLALLIMRLLWRWRNARPAPPAQSLRWERWAAAGGHIGLYLLMLAMTFTGWALAGTFRQPLDASLLGFIDVPAITSPANPELHESLEEWHALLAWPLTILIAIHILSAFYHLWVKKDGVMQRMLSAGSREQGTV
jgi:cytochrome b561